MTKQIIEVWKPVVGYEEFYEISNVGRVKSKERKVWNGKVYSNKKERILKPSKTSTGYFKVELTVNKVRKSFKVHRLVAFSFIPIVHGKTLINHKDGDPLNNAIGNLEWCTQSENMKHAAKMQLIPNNFNLHKDKIVSEYKNGDLNVRQLARKYGCSDKTIRDYFKANGIRIRTLSEVQDKYKIDRLVLVQDFERGMRNVDIAKKHKTNRLLIGTYKHMHKKGELL